MLGQSMIAIQKPGDVTICRYGGAAVLWGYSCLSSQLDAVVFICDFTVYFVCSFTAGNEVPQANTQFSQVQRHHSPNTYPDTRTAGHVSLPQQMCA